MITFPLSFVVLYLIGVCGMLLLSIQHIHRIVTTKVYIDIFDMRRDTTKGVVLFRSVGLLILSFIPIVNISTATFWPLIVLFEKFCAGKVGDWWRTKI